jgi:hypothetical protein
VPIHWLRALALKRPNVQRQQLADWDAAIVRAFNELTRSELDEFSSGKESTQLRKIVAAFRMESDLNALASMRMFVERVRLAPLCFSAQFVAEMWSVDKILQVLVVINYGGLHIYSMGSSPVLISSFDFNTLISWQVRFARHAHVPRARATQCSPQPRLHPHAPAPFAPSWQTMNNMLIINVIYAQKGANGALGRRSREKLRFLTKESVPMCGLLGRYAEAVLADVDRRRKERAARTELERGDGEAEDLF